MQTQNLLIRVDVPVDFPFNCEPYQTKEHWTQIQSLLMIKYRVWEVATSSWKSWMIARNT